MNPRRKLLINGLVIFVFCGVVALLYETRPEQIRSRLAERSLPQVNRLLLQDDRFAKLHADLAGGKVGLVIVIGGEVTSEQVLSDLKASVTTEFPRVGFDWVVSVSPESK